MARRGPERRLSTALFVDVVESTRIALDVGDERWRELLRTFRRVVRRELRRHGGREEDTAGDGFFATFDRPAAAVRAAAGIVAEGQSVGLDVRCGVHTGELERIDGRLGGIAAHIAARVLSLAPPASVVVTSTVRDLVVGGGISFGRLGETELKGLPERWTLYRVDTVDRRSLPAALDPAEAAQRRQGLAAGSRRGAVWVGLAVAGVLAVLAAAIVWRQAAAPEVRLNGSPRPSAPPIALVRVDPQTNAVAELVRDEHVSVESVSGLRAVAGNLWQTDNRSLIRRDLMTGAFQASQALPPETLTVVVAFGSIWVAHGSDTTRIDRLDPISGRRLAQIDPQTGVWDLTAGDDAMFALGFDAEVIEIDPVTNEIADRDPGGTSRETYYVRFADGLLYLCECPAERIAVFDPDRDELVRTVDVDFPGTGSVDSTGTIWVVDREASTVTPFDPDRPDDRRSIGLDGPLGETSIGYSTLWVAAGDAVHRIGLGSRRVTSIAMPRGAFAASVAIDEDAGIVWVSSCICTEQH